MDPDFIRKHCQLEFDAQQAFDTLGLSRAHNLKVAHTIADLAGEEKIGAAYCRSDPIPGAGSEVLGVMGSGPIDGSQSYPQ